MNLRVLIAPLAALLAPSLAAAAPILSFEFNTPGDTEGWQHNGGANGGTTGLTTVTTSGGEGVLTSTTLGPATSGDLRVLYNPDFSLPAGFDSWSAVDIRFRQLDDQGAPRDLAGADSSLHLGINAAAISINGSGFVEETPGDQEFWYTATLDISGNAANDITQIRIDPITTLRSANYELDYVRLSGVPAIPEPASLAIAGLAFVSLVTRSRCRD
ncbi:hypothetical protein MalM25_16830 [Planctomycetes bacterium MalM25]|nr:hypothetical protein MalM25_16830 [Planctomycetes bacterium MalM25]